MKIKKQPAGKELSTIIYARPTTTLYSLNEGAKKVNCSAKELLHYGARGSIELLVGVPPRTILHLLDGASSTRVTGIPAPMRTPNILVLRPEHCLLLELSGKADISDVPLGYSYSGDNQFRTCHPSNSDENLPVNGEIDISWKHPLKRWTAWSIQSEEPDSHIEVNLERVLVASIEIDRIFNINSASPGNVKEWYKSDNLQYMNQAAYIFWGNIKIVKEDKLTHPKKEDVVQWFIDKEFSPSLAEKAASLIRPEFAGTGRPLLD